MRGVKGSGGGCSIEGCVHPHQGRGLCVFHFNAVRGHRAETAAPIMLMHARQSSRRRGHTEPEITLNELRAALSASNNRPCPVFPWVTIRLGSSERRDDAPSIDRLDNAKGYIQGNWRIISWRANRVKGALSPKELIALAADVYTGAAYSRT